jgi:ABC-type multidrug transport system fused ATPase/permease subunit
MFFAAFTSLQRFAEYRSEEVPQEKAWFVGNEKAADPAVSWPQSGSLVFDKVTLIYRAGLSPAVKQVSFSIEDGAKVGVVGRTGAGKSSLAVLLFRINEAAEGTITLDGRNIAEAGLQTLRQACAIIPQDPLLLNGTVRRNLDPFNAFADKGDAFLRKCLQKVGLDQNLLDTELGGGSSGLSAGEKQLLSLARVLLRHDTIRLVVMDEPTGKTLLYIIFNPYHLTLCFCSLSDTH